MIGLLLYVLVVLIVFWILYYMITNMLPDALRRPATVVLVVLGGIFLIYLLLYFAPALTHRPWPLVR